MICSKHRCEYVDGGCIECKKELGLSMTKAQKKTLGVMQSNFTNCPTRGSECDCADECQRLKNLNRTVPIAHFEYRGQEGSTRGSAVDYVKQHAVFLRDGREFIVSEQQPVTFDDAVEMVAREIAGLVIKKQHDYGHDNINAFGETGVIVRISDKVARLRNIFKTGKTPANEAIDDTYMDLAGYAIIALMLRRDWFKLELEGE